MDEWVSEGVQVGGVASAMGVMGLWTGATHERIDPLGRYTSTLNLDIISDEANCGPGPCWAWKVG